VGRSHAFLRRRVGLPLVDYKMYLATNGSAQPKASARNEVAAPRVVGSYGRTSMSSSKTALALAGLAALPFTVGFALADVAGFGYALEGVLFGERFGAHEGGDFAG
jgi:hypothetical protein